MARKVDLGITKLGWGLVLADPAAPSTAELGVFEDLSCLMVTSYEVRADASDTVSEKAVCESANSDTPTAANYIGNLVMFRQWDEANSMWDTDEDPVEIFPHSGITGFFARRIGLPYDTAWADGQQVETYKFVTDHPQISGGNDQGYVKVTVPLLKQGVMHLDAVVGGVSSSS